MKAKFLFAFLVIFTATFYAQKIQICHVREQNSQKRPLPNTQVIFSDAVPTTSDQSGRVSLVFSGKNAGDWVFLTEVLKSGYELVNKKEIEQVKLSASDQLGIDIILAKTGLVEAAKKKYYDISDKSLKADFEKEKNKLRLELTNARLTAQQFGEKAGQLQLDYEKQKKELDALAEKFARINFDDVDALYRKCLELFKDGKIDEAISKLEAANPTRRTEQILNEEKRIAQAEIELNERKVVLAKEKQGQIAAIRLLADMYGLKFNPVKAEYQYDQLVLLDTTDLTILKDAAFFYKENHRYNKAKRLYSLILLHPKADEQLIGKANRYLGELNIEIGRFQEALVFFTKYHDLFEKMYMENPLGINCKGHLAVSYLKLGVVQFALTHWSEALKFFNQYYALAKELNQSFPNDLEFKNSFANAHCWLGITHTELGNLIQALAYFEQYNSIEKEIALAGAPNFEYKNSLAISYEKIGDTHAAMGNLAIALVFYESFNRLLTELFKEYPYNVDLKNGIAISFEKIGSTHIALGSIDKGEKYYEQYNQLEKELFANFPQNVNFKNVLAISFGQLGTFYDREKNDKTKARECYEQGLKLHQELASLQPGNIEFKERLEWVQNMLLELDISDNIVNKLNLKIENATDSLIKYQLMGELCDSLRRIIITDAQQKTTMANALADRAWFGFFLQKFEGGERDIREAISLGTENKYLVTNLAPALLLQGKFDLAKIEYDKWKDIPFDEPDLPTYREVFLEDLNALEQAGAIPTARNEALAAVRKLLAEK